MPEVSFPQKKRWPLYVLAAFLSLFVIGGGAFMAKSTTAFQALLSANEKKDVLLPGENEENIPLTAELYAAHAEEALASGNPEDAVLSYEKALEKGGELPIMRRLFDAALLSGDTGKAEEVLGLMAFRGTPENVLETLRGLVLIRKNDLPGARMLFEKEPLRGDSRFGLLLVSIIEGNHGEAKEHLSVLQTSTDPLMVHSARVVQGAYDEFALFEDDGRDEHLQTLLARSLGQIGQWPIVEKILEGVIASESDYRDAEILLGYARIMMGSPAEALQSLEHAYSLDPEKAETQYFLGLAHEKLGHETEATMFLSYALQNGFTDKRVLREKLAKLAQHHGAYEEAIGQYRAMVDEGNAPEQTYRALATLLIDHRKDLDQARSLALEAREKFGDSSAEALHLMGWTSFLKDELDEAASFLRTATEQDPTLAIAWYHRGLLEEKVGDREQAITSYQRAYDESIGRDEKIAMEAVEKHNALLVQEEGDAVSR